MDIYWIKDKRQYGPSTVPDVISLLQVGELTPDTLGWHVGCTAWCPLRELPALSDFLNKQPELAEEEGEAPNAQAEAPGTPLPAPAAAGESAVASEAESEIPASYAAQRVYLPSPVARMLARFVDYGLYALLYAGIIHLRAIPYDAMLLLQVNPLLWMPMLVLEAWMLSTWGTTPGKALMGISVTTFGDVPRLSFLRALVRSLSVFALGMGLMIPQILPIMLAFEYWMLRRRGITPWDARNSTLPTQKKPASPSRYTLAVVCLYVCAVLFFTCMKPWLPGMLDDIARENPEVAQSLRELMPKEEAAATTKPAPQAAPAEPARGQTSLPGI